MLKNIFFTIQAGASLGRDDNLVQPPDDFSRDGGGRGIYVNDDWMLVRRRLFKDCELAVEQGHGHEMLVPCRHAGVDQIV
jgi:hypothetical protein